MDQVILVTGANGFVGRNVVHHLSALPGVRIVATDVHGALAPLHGVPRGDVAYVKGDMASREFLASLRGAGPFGTIIHLAAVISQSPDTDTYYAIMDSNIRATFLLLDMAREQGSRVIFPSTALVYGPQKGPFREEMAADPGDFYALSKLSCEQLIRFYGSRYGVGSVILRIGVLYGPSQSGAMFVPSLISALLDGREFPMTKGEQSRDFVYIEDLIAAMSAAIGLAAASGVYNIGTGVPSTLREVAALAERLTGRPGLVRLGAIPYREKESWEYCLDSSRARRELGWEPRIGLEEGLRRTIEYEEHRRRIHAQP